MKKVLLILLLSLTLTGCGKMNETEARHTLLFALNQAYKVVYSTNGFGLAVFPNEKIESEGSTWYLVGTEGYSSTTYLKELANEAFVNEVAKNLIISIDSKYKDIDGKLYSKGLGGCDLGYNLDAFESMIEGEVTINKIKTKEIKFTYKGKEYKLKRIDETWKLTENIFTCIKNDI